MKKLTQTLGVLLLTVVAFAPSTRAQEQSVVIFDPASTATETIRAQGVELSRDAQGALSIVNGKEDKWPGVHFTGNWDLGAYDALEVKLRSTSSESITIYCRLDCAASDQKTLDGVVTRQITLAPGEQKTWLVKLPQYLNLETREKLFAMRGKPGGITTDSYSKDAKTPFDKRELIAVRPFENQNGRGDSWVLESIVAVPSDPAKLAEEEYLSWAPDKFFPMIDQFGQFKHADWKGKTHSLDELRAQIAKEDADLAARQPTAFDEYGGWLDGPQLEATGAFRTAKVDGVWYLVDPAGRLFWSNGVDCVGHSNAVTPVSDREFYFDEAIPTRPNDDNKLSQFLSTRDHSVNNYYAGYGKYWQYNFSASNLYLKFGDNWIEAEKDLVKRRLRSWGLNTIGNWSDMNIAKYAKTPYVATVNSNSPFIEGSKGYWGKFVDPFDPAFPQGIRRSLSAVKFSSDDPYCIGYFVDNEISWGEAGSLAQAALTSPKTQAVKVAYVKWLQEKYGAIEKFNQAWGVDLESWEKLADEPFETPKSDPAKEDSNAFYTVICEKYFQEIVAAIREVAPKKLYLGCRFAWTNELARAAAQKYCDVVSYNFYQKEVGSFKPVEGVDKPVIIGEFHFGALDRGMFHTGLGPCADQNERAAAYETYVKSALGNPWIVGAHWFEYGDEPTTGRFDGENYQIGLLDVCDVPYEETIDAVRRVGYNIYSIRSSAGSR